MPSLCYHDPPFGDVVYAGQDLAKVGPSVVTRNGVPLSLEQSQRVWNHSSDGFSWGYHGSGPAQLALESLAGKPLAVLHYPKRYFLNVNYQIV